VQTNSFHFRCEKDGPVYDTVNKIRDFADPFWRKCLEMRAPDQVLSLDEAILPMTSHWKHKVFIENKPHPEGVKLFSINGSKDGYCYGAFIFAGDKNQAVCLINL
jgi:hypothetical protein